MPWEIAGPILLAQRDTERELPTTRTAGTDRPALRKAPLPVPLEKARSDLARIFFHYKPESKEWALVAALIEHVVPKKAGIEEPPAAPRRLPKRPAH